MGLLAKATAILEQKQKVTSEAVVANQLAADFAAQLSLNTDVTTDKVDIHRQTAETKSTPVHTMKSMPKRHSTGKLRKFAASVLVGLAIQTAAPFSFGKSDAAAKNVHPEFAKEITNQSAEEIAAMRFFEETASKMRKPKISFRDRNDMARMLYGEAGRGTDPFEVLHTLLNRLSSPLFKGEVIDLLTAENQYLGYHPDNPVLPQLRRIVDFVVDEYEKNGCQQIEDCHRFYFVTDVQNDCNKFEISKDPNGRWVAQKDKQYAARKHYCTVATDQAKRFSAVTNLPSYERPF